VLSPSVSHIFASSWIAATSRSVDAQRSLERIARERSSTELVGFSASFLHAKSPARAPPPRSARSAIPIATESTKLRSRLDP
jgi:hypothetical protein